jgi:hypothetical protein
MTYNVAASSEGSNVQIPCGFADLSWSASHCGLEQRPDKPNPGWPNRVHWVVMQGYIWHECSLELTNTKRANKFFPFSPSTWTFLEMQFV